MKRLALFLFLLSTLACSRKDEELTPGTSFTKIFDHSGFSGDIDALAVVQVPDSGYLALAARDTWNIYLLKTKENGDIEWELTLNEPYVNPLPGIVKKDDAYYMACMDEVSLSTYLMKIDLQGDQPSVAATFPDIKYPLSFSATPDGGFLIQGYDREAQSTTLTKITTGLTKAWSKKYPVLENVEEILIKHLNRTGVRLPFANGTVLGGGNAGYYYFNGFMNFTVSLVFVDAADGEPVGNINGFRDQGYINAAYPLENNMFALARTDFDDSYLLPLTPVDLRSIVFSGDLTSNNFPEISAHARIVIREATIGSRDVLLYGTHTKNNQVILYSYDKENGELLGVEYIGHTNPYQMGDFLLTEDGGLVVLSKTYVAKRFARLALFKLTPEEVSNILQ